MSPRPTPADVRAALDQALDQAQGVARAQQDAAALSHEVEAAALSTLRQHGIDPTHPDRVVPPVAPLAGAARMRPTTACALAPFIGRTAQVKGNGIRPSVRILDARLNWGRVQLLIAPLAGEGTQWVDEGTIQILPGSQRAAVVEVL